MGMRKIAVLPVSIAGALIMGLIWTVGQTGLSDTNAHLCELFSRYLPDVPENCQASDWIVTIAGYLFILATAIAVLDIGWIIFKWSSKKQKETQESPLEIIFNHANPGLGVVPRVKPWTTHFPAQLPRIVPPPSPG